MKEIFKVIEEYPEYEVSNHGRIRYKNKIINESTDQNGYKYFCIYNDAGDKLIDGKRIHRQVANAFLPNNNNEQIVKHRDDNKENNNVNNLYYYTLPEADKNKLLTNRISSSGYLGVQYIKNKMSAKYRVVITENKRPKHIGYYETLDEAILARLEVL